MSINHCSKKYDVVVVGGGMAGLNAAIAAARHGVKVAIVQNRSVFGGTGSSEIRMHIVGANCHSSKANLRETGIIEEILLENKRRNPYASFPTFDLIMWEKVYMEKNITMYMNTNMDDAVVENNNIKKIICHQNSTETEYIIEGDIFIDATGHGTLGVMANAKYRIGSEGKKEFNEPTAPDEPNNNKMGNTIMFVATDRKEKVTFIKPSFANTYTEYDLRNRPHVDCVGAQADGGGIVAVDKNKNQLPEFSNVDAGYWWIELGGDSEDIIREGEDIKVELLKVLYGVWDHIKNGGNHGADNLDIEWAGMVPGYRESRRLEGKYILNENDIRSNRVFDDAVAYGGWPMDVHVPGGAKDLDSFGSKVYNFEGCYTIPYRCYISSNIDNLMMCGRDISCSKMAFSSTRVMGTCSIGGQAVGVAASIAIKNNCSLSEVGEKYISDLQQILLKEDCFIPGFKNQDEKDIARFSKITATSFYEDGKPENVINGVSRSYKNDINMWVSDEIKNLKPSLFLELNQIHKINEVRITFDTDLSHEIQPSLIKNVLNRQVKGLPHELVKDYEVILRLNGKEVLKKCISENGQRLNVLHFDGIEADNVEIKILSTYGCERAHIFEVRIY